MKSVLMSIQPKWCELIASGKKTVEVRKTKPKLDTPFKVYIYCTKDKKNLFFPPIKKPILREANYVDNPMGNGKVIGEFVCDKIIDIDYGIEEGVYFDGEYQEGFETNGNGNNPTCLSFTELENYLTENVGYGWHISNLVIYDKPRELSEFSAYKKDKCPANLNGVCLDRERNDVVLCENLDCPHKRITRPPQSWCYVESEVDTE